jgi:hypothetical protein
MDLIFRFILGESLWSLFAIIGDVMKPKTFAGLFAAAVLPYLRCPKVARHPSELH